MKKIITVIIALVVVTFVKIGWEVNGLFTQFQASRLKQSNEVHFRKLLQDEEKKPGNPLNIRIPKIHIDTKVQVVGMDKLGNMDIPTNNVDTAWYKFGSKPGEIGNAVINGHYDSNTGAPAVFYNLAKLDVGDTINVSDSKGRTYMFEVFKKDYFPYDDKNHLTDIFGPSEKPQLNLITCNGIFNPQLGVYSKRLVVFTELKSKISSTYQEANTE